MNTFNKPQIGMTSPENWTLKTRLIGSFVLIVLLVGLLSYLNVRYSLNTITRDAIPPLQTMAQVIDLAKSIRGETVEYVATGEEEVLAEFDEHNQELDALLAPQEGITADVADKIPLADTLLTTEQISALGLAIIQSHRQTLEALETLEDLEGEMEGVFEEAISVVDEELARNLEEGELDELVEDALPTQRLLTDLIDQARTLQAEALEYVATGEEETLKEFEETAEQLAATREALEPVLESDEPGEEALAANLIAFEAGLQSKGREIIETHSETLALLESFEELEEDLETAIEAGQAAVDQNVSDGVVAVNRNAVIISLIILVLAAMIGVGIARTVTKPVHELVAAAREIGAGNLSARARAGGQNEIGELAASFNQMTDNLSQKIEAEQVARSEAERVRQALEAQVWQTTGLTELNDEMRGQADISTLANSIIKQLCHYLQAQIGALYIASDEQLTLAGGFAYNGRQPAPHFHFGQGLVGQAAVEKRSAIVTNIPDDYITVRSGLGETIPRTIAIFPFVYEEQLVGVIELGTLSEFNQAELDFLEAALNNIAITFNTAQARVRIDELLIRTQQQAEELQAQSEELRVANEELETQTESLRASEARLKEKQTELENANAQLEEQTAALAENSRVLQEKQAVLDRHNRELKVAQQELEQKAAELAVASKYKSEFLANMSHELRTPLNSLLILARMLAENEEGNLSEEQVESAEIIHGAGADLLNLINDILDLSKVEAGQMVFHFEPMPLVDLGAMAQAQFGRLAEEKGLALRISLTEDLPETVETDPQRVKQVIKNLLSNAFKFTESGWVSLDIARPAAGADLSRSGLDPAGAVAIAISDSGIGMTPEQQQIIFEAFQQGDGSTNRQYGGTGLGLSISRELTARLGGEITVTSEVGRGSCFTLYLPLTKPADSEPAATPSPAQAIKPAAAPLTPAAAPQPPVPMTRNSAPADDRAALVPEDKVVLIIEDDPKFARIVRDFSHSKGFKCLIAGDGKAGLALVKEFQPEGVILDLHLPDISGWTVLERMKQDATTRHIPVHIISMDEEVLDAYRKGAIGYLTKPVDKAALDASFQKIEQVIANEIKTLLLVEDDAKARQSIKKLLGGSDVQISEAERGEVALALLGRQHFDCMILDLTLPDMSGFEVLSRMNGNGKVPRCPVIVYTGRELTPEENLELMKYTDSVIVKGVKSPERLLDETALFLHRVVSEMPPDRQQTIKQLYQEDGLLKGKKILVVDDDMRNSFALSKLLSEKGLTVRIAQNGQKALDLLATEPVDLVLMDIMMPVLDGYETTRRIRLQPALSNLPILALTAKAMKGDREKCLAAGANDYLPKPIDVDRLFSMLRVWLYQ